MNGLIFIRDVLKLKRNSKEYTNWRGAICLKALCRALGKEQYGGEDCNYYQNVYRHFHHQGHKYTLFTINQRVKIRFCERTGLWKSIAGNNKTAHYTNESDPYIVVCQGTIKKYDRSRQVAYTSLRGKMKPWRYPDKVI